MVVLEAMATGESCLAFTYSGDAIQAAARAAEAGKGGNLRYVAPKEGAQLWFDMLAIPADAPHANEAHAFINFILAPEVMAGITNQLRYPNAVPATAPYVLPEIAADPGVYPTAEARGGFFTIKAVPADAVRQRARMWARFKAGRG